MLFDAIFIVYFAFNFFRVFLFIFSCFNVLYVRISY